MTVILRIKGSDLQALREHKLSRDEGAEARGREALLNRRSGDQRSRSGIRCRIRYADAPDIEGPVCRRARLVPLAACGSSASAAHQQAGRSRST